jgi:calpain
MLFRAADTEGLCMVKVEDFRLFLGRVRLGLSQSQITMIVRILDEDCSGIVKKDEYYDTLSAYGINEEK